MVAALFLLFLAGLQARLQPKRRGPLALDMRGHSLTFLARAPTFVIIIVCASDENETVKV